MNLNSQNRQQLNDLFALNRRVMKAYLLKESLERLWTYHYEGAMLLDHLDGILLNYCRIKVPFGVVEAINYNIKTLLGRGRGYKNLGYLLLFRKQPKMRVSTNSRAEPVFQTNYLLDSPHHVLCHIFRPGNLW
jgi:hypothetical protein